MLELLVPLFLLFSTFEPIIPNPFHVTYFLKEKINSGSSHSEKFVLRKIFRASKNISCFEKYFMLFAFLQSIFHSTARKKLSQFFPTFVKRSSIFLLPDSIQDHQLKLLRIGSLSALLFIIQNQSQ